MGKARPAEKRPVIEQRPTRKPGSRPRITEPTAPPADDSPVTWFID